MVITRLFPPRCSRVCVRKDNFLVRGTGCRIIHAALIDLRANRSPGRRGGSKSCEMEPTL
eukprot:2535446-Heterocapsa_arctica.AAC.1